MIDSCGVVTHEIYEIYEIWSNIFGLNESEGETWSEIFLTGKAWYPGAYMDIEYPTIADDGVMKTHLVSLVSDLRAAIMNWSRQSAGSSNISQACIAM